MFTPMSGVKWLFKLYVLPCRRHLHNMQPKHPGPPHPSVYLGQQECERGHPLPALHSEQLLPGGWFRFATLPLCIQGNGAQDYRPPATSIFVWQPGRLLQEEEDAYPQKCKWTSYCSQVNHSCSGLRFWFAIGITSSDYCNDCYLTEDGGGWKEGPLLVIIIIGSIK